MLAATGNFVKTMRVTKREIYARFGIVYNGEKLESPIGPVRPLLINGNAKIGKGVYHFSTLPTNKTFSATVCGKSWTVKGTCPCHCAGCYACSGNYCYESTISALAMRTILARDYLDWTRRAILAQIIADKIQLLRVHAAGDFFSAEYIEMWREIAIANPTITMWTYTKNSDAESAFDDIANFNVVKSIIPGKGVNFGHCDYIIALYDYLKAAGKSVYICRCGIDKNQHCTNCSHCATSDYVLFLEHSTGYKAEKDPLFPVVKALIESQAETIAAAAD